MQHMRIIAPATGQSLMPSPGRPPFALHLPYSSGRATIFASLTGALCLAGMLAPLGTPPAAAASNEILVLVNDEPITAYEMEQRQRLLGLSADIGSYIRDNAKKRWESIVKNPKINDEFRAFAVKRNPKSKEELQKIQQEFIKQKQKAMMDGLQAEARSRANKGTDRAALRELVEERLKLQEAKRNNVVASDEQISKIITGIASRNKMNEEQFGKHLAGMGVDISTMRARFRAAVSWNEVVRRRFGYQVSITERDVERFVEQDNSSAMDDGSGAFELVVQRVTLPVGGNLDQKQMAERLAQADQLRAKFAGCKSTEKLAKSFGANFENVGARNAASIGEPMRTLLLNAKQDQMIPPNVGPDGVEMWALCGKKQIAGKAGGAPGAPGAGGGSSAKDDRRDKEFDILAKKHLKDLRQDATIDCRAEAKSGLCQSL